MGTKGASLVTLLDVAKTKDKQIGKVAEVLAQVNPMLMDIPYMEMNEGTIHKESIRSALPSVYYRKANQPIPASKTGTEERSFTAAHIESKSVIDEMVASRGGKDRIPFNRWNEAQGHIQAMAIEHADLTIYGSPDDDPRKVAGFMDIFSTLNTSEPTYRQIVDGGGSSGDNTSILKVHWGPQSVFGVYPAGCTAGLKRTDRSPGNTRIQIQGTDENGNTGHFWGFEEDFAMDHGLVVKDYRQVVRIANIDVSDLIAGSGADLIDMMISANYIIHDLQVGKGVWYANRTVFAMLHKQARNAVGGGGGLTFENFEGRKILTFLGDPVRMSDALLNTESQVTT